MEKCFNCQSILLIKGSCSSEDSNYESMQIYEEIDSLREFTPSTSCLLNDLRQSKNDEQTTEGQPPSILRPPDISDIFSKFWSEDNDTEQSRDLKYGNGARRVSLVSKCSPICQRAALSSGVSPHSAIPRPKVGWLTRKVTFGKLFNALIKIFSINGDFVQLCVIRNILK